MFLCAAEGNWGVDCTKLLMSFFVTIKFSLSISLGYLWCVFVVSFQAVQINYHIDFSFSPFLLVGGGQRGQWERFLYII